MPTARVFFLGSLALSLALAQPAPEQPPTIKVEVDIVNIFCSVRDKRGGFVSNLTKDDFTVFEDGKQQTVKYFTRETDLPLTLGMMVDVSGSQERLIDTERNAAGQFFSQVLRKKDMAFLISFGAEAELLQDLTNSPRLLRSALDQLRLNAGATGIGPGPVPTISQPRGTILFDAVYLAANEKLRGEVGRKGMVLITDGIDQGSRVKISEALGAAQRADAIIYSIYYVDPGAYQRGGGGIWIGGAPSNSDLKRMSEETGGHLFRVDRKHTLQDIFKELQEELRSQYAIGYTPGNANKDGGFRRLEIRVRDKDMKVQARKGYFAIKPESR
jgi:VWFA-related protein